MGRLRIQHRETGEIPALHPAKKGLFIILVFILPGVLSGQEKSIPFNISFFNESTAIPFTRLITIPVHPGLQVGTEFNYRVREHSRLFQTVNIGYFYHRYLAQGIGINTELGYEYRLKSGLAFQGLFGVGYMHTFTTAEEFIFSNGQYEQQADQGNARVTPSLSFDLGYYLKKTAINSPKIFCAIPILGRIPLLTGFYPCDDTYQPAPWCQIFYPIKDSETWLGFSILLSFYAYLTLVIKGKTLILPFMTANSVLPTAVPPIRIMPNTRFY